MSTLLEHLRLAHSRQRYAETAMNSRSSRAHTVLILHVSQQAKRKDITTAASAASISGVSKTCGVLLAAANSTAATSPNANDDEMLLVTSQLHLVDLAGSERVKKSKVTGQRMKEAVGINSSLLVLGKVISALVKGEYHVPYLESKLTTLLKAAFGGNAKTHVMINTRPESDYGDETLQSLRFGERCSMISNQLRSMATSLESTLFALDQAIETLQQQLTSLAARGKSHLDSYQALQVTYDSLMKKRQELVKNHPSHQHQKKSISSHMNINNKAHRPVELYM